MQCCLKVGLGIISFLGPFPVAKSMRLNRVRSMPEASVDLTFCYADYALHAFLGTKKLDTLIHLLVSNLDLIRRQCVELCDVLQN